MTTIYSVERGKYGLFTGCVVPFPRFLSGNSPNGADWKDFVPSGFLRCDGSKYRGRDYPVLANILGMGSTSKFKKFNVELEEPTEDLTFGQFQVPDLGAKYINASNVSGGYNNLYATTTTGTQVPTCGVPGEIILNQGENIDVFYTGNFLLGNSPVFLPSAMNFVSTLIPTAPSSSVQSAGFLPHAHFSEATVMRGGVANTDNIITTVTGTPSSGQVVEDAQGSFSQALSTSAGSESGTSHNHFFKATALDRDTELVLSQAELTSAFLTTTVTLNNEKTIKFDDIQHKYMLVEWLIKF